MSWWTKNRKKVGIAAALIAAPYALPALGSALGIGAVPAAGGAVVPTGTALTGSGMMGMSAVPAAFSATPSASAAAPEIAGTLAPEALKAGMFSGPETVNALKYAAADGTTGMIPAAPGMEASAARDALRIAQEGAGKLNPLEYLKEVGRADLMNMNNPAELGQRLATNAGRFAGNMGKSMATGAVAQALMGSPAPTPAPPPPGPQGPSTPPPDVFAASNGGGFADANLDALAAKLGIPKSELIKMLDQMKGQYA